jgi:hypothetical protein
VENLWKTRGKPRRHSVETLASSSSNLPKQPSPNSLTSFPISSFQEKTFSRRNKENFTSGKVFQGKFRFHMHKLFIADDISEKNKGKLRSYAKRLR